MSQAPITTYAQAVTARLSSAITAELYDDMAALAVDVAGFGTYSVQRALPELQGRAQQVLEQLRVLVVQGGNPKTANLAGSSWVDITLDGFFDEPRILALKAQWLLQLSTIASSAGPYTCSPGDLVAQDDQDNTYALIEPVKVPGSGEIPGLFESRVAGVIGNAAPGLIDHLVVGKPGLVVSNSAPAGRLVLGGRDAESDAAYLIRCLGKWGLLSAGLRFEERIKSAKAYDFLIPGAAPTVTRWLVRDDNPFGPGTIGVCLADAAGPATQEEVDAVAAVLVPIKPLGSGKLTVFAAAPQNVAIVAKLFTDGSNANAEANAQAALAALGVTYPIGSLQVVDLFRAKIVEVLMEVPGMLNVRISSPATDVGLAPYAVIVLSPAPALTVVT